MKSIGLLLAVSVAGCAMVGSRDSDAWVGRTADSLDTHVYLRTLPMIRTTTSAGTELRNYQNRPNTSQCYAEGNVTAGAPMSFNTYTQVVACTGRSAGCDYVFTLRDGKVVEYGTGGRMFDARSCAAATTERRQ